MILFTRTANAFCGCVDLVTRLRAGWSGFDSLRRDEKVLSLRHRVQTGSHTPNQWFGGSFPRDKAAGVKLTTHLHQVPSLGMRGAILPLIQYTFMVWRFLKHKEKFIVTMWPWLLVSSVQRNGNDFQIHSLRFVFLLSSTI